MVINSHVFQVSKLRYRVIFSKFHCCKTAKLETDTVPRYIHHFL